MHDVLIGECKWSGQRVGRSVVDDLIERKGPRLKEILAEKSGDWTLHYAIFARTA